MTDSTQVTTTTNYYSLTLPTTSNFGYLPVDFDKFREAEPESTWSAGALSSLEFSAAALATAAALVMF